jgi:dTDP-4-amino-4,6-dideoxy-D-glucose acyltransferase
VISAFAVVFDNALILRPDKVEIGEYSRIDSFVKIEGGEGVKIGRYVHIASFAHIGVGGGVTIIEDYATVSSGGKLISGSHQTSGLTMSANAPKELQHIKRVKTHLKRFSCVFTNAVVLPGLTLGEGAVLGAGSVATCDIPEWEIWVGVPARFIKRRHVNDEYSRRFSF